MVTIKDISDGPVECYMALSIALSAVIFFFEKGPFLTGLHPRRKKIVSWRAMEILSMLDEIEVRTMALAHLVSERAFSHQKVFDPDILKEITDKIGKDSYDRIMSIPVPRELIDAIIESHTEDDIISISEEISAGTMVWEDRFSEIGVMHPDKLAEESRRRETVISRYRDFLASYGKFVEADEETMNCVECRLVSLSDQERINQLKDQLVVAVAGLLGGSAMFHCSNQCSQWDSIPASFKEVLSDLSLFVLRQKTVLWLVAEMHISKEEAYKKLAEALKLF